MPVPVALVLLAVALVWAAVLVVVVALCAAARRADDADERDGLALPGFQTQYAPRPESTAGTVAKRISRSRPSDQPRTYW